MSAAEGKFRPTIIDPTCPSLSPLPFMHYERADRNKSKGQIEFETLEAEYFDDLLSWVERLIRGSRTRKKNYVAGGLENLMAARRAWVQSKVRSLVRIQQIIHKAFRNIRSAQARAIAKRIKRPAEIPMKIKSLDEFHRKKAEYQREYRKLNKHERDPTARRRESWKKFSYIKRFCEILTSCKDDTRMQWERLVQLHTGIPPEMILEPTWRGTIMKVWQPHWGYFYNMEPEAKCPLEIPYQYPTRDDGISDDPYKLNEPSLTMAGPKGYFPAQINLIHGGQMTESDFE